ncbi:MAG TPA: hypothetical protein VG738_11435 [Chitinophagaceae bacterium]|nr:hypothetical protein [Chitinophagaceae bacterium]
METGSIVVFTLVGFALNLLIIYYIIQSATKTSQKMDYMKMQVKLLIKIAQANGATDETIDEIIHPKKK